MWLKIDKRGEDIVLPNSLKLIIAVLCMIALIYLAVSLYTLFTVKSETAQAKGTLDNLVSEIAMLESGKKQAGSYLIVSPKGWGLMVRDNKLCICGEDELGSFEDCSKRGICSETKLKLKLAGYCSIVVNCLALENLPRALFLEKQEDFILLRNQENLITQKIEEEVFGDREDGEKVKSLMLDYLEGRGKSQELNVALREYFEKLDTEGLFGIDKERFKWELRIVKFQDGRAVNGYPGIFNNLADEPVFQSYGKEEFVVLELGEDNQYRLTFIFREGDAVARTVI